MEFGFEPVCDQLRAGSSYLDSRHPGSLIETNALPLRQTSTSGRTFTRRHLLADNHDVVDSRQLLQSLDRAADVLRLSLELDHQFQMMRVVVVSFGRRRIVDAAVAWGPRLNVLHDRSTALHRPAPNVNHVNNFSACQILTLLLTLCGLTGQKTHREGLRLSGSVHEEAHPCFPYYSRPRSPER